MTPEYLVTHQVASRNEANVANVLIIFLLRIPQSTAHLMDDQEKFSNKHIMLFIRTSMRVIEMKFRWKYFSPISHLFLSARESTHAGSLVYMLRWFRRKTQSHGERGDDEFPSNERWVKWSDNPLLSEHRNVRKHFSSTLSDETADTEEKADAKWTSREERILLWKS